MVTHGPILLLLQLCNSRPQRYASMRFFNFVVLSVITAPTTHISETYLPIVLLNVRELELNWYSKDQEKGSPLWMAEAQIPPKLIDSLNGAPSLHRGMRLPNAVQSK